MSASSYYSIVTRYASCGNRRLGGIPFRFNLDKHYPPLSPEHWCFSNWYPDGFSLSTLFWLQGRVYLLRGCLSTTALLVLLRRSFGGPGFWGDRVFFLSKSKVSPFCVKYECLAESMQDAFHVCTCEGDSKPTSCEYQPETMVDLKIRNYLSLVYVESKLYGNIRMLCWTKMFIHLCNYPIH